MLRPHLSIFLFSFTAPLVSQSLFTTPYTGAGFEVALIKPANPGERSGGIPPAQAGRLRAINVTIRELLGYAFHTTSAARTSGGPSWLDSERFDVTAMTEGNPTEDQMRPMVLKLIEDRMALQYRRETRQMNAYLLTVVKSGPRLAFSNSCKPDPEQKMPCGGFRVFKRSYIGGQSVSMGDLTEVLEALLGDPVIDRTGIADQFAAKLQWTPDDFQQRGAEPGASTPAAEGPSLFSAIEEQLGLKLERRRTSVNVIVVTRAQQPSAN